jgi:hypothetical protein
MKRRDFLKQGGVAALGAPAAASLLAASSGCGTRGKDLVVSFAGPFCFWWNTPLEPTIKVMVPRVGPKCEEAPHQPWFGTTQNEKRITEEDLGKNIEFRLDLPGYNPPQSPQKYNQLAPFGYEQTSDKQGPVLFNLTIPMPNIFIGARPTSVKMQCNSNPSDNYCTNYITYASSMIFVYKKIDLNGVRITQGKENFFTPCFENDKLLCAGELGIHMTPLTPLDADHNHATAVWCQMLAMYPWMNKEITGLDFCPNFDHSSCNASCFDKKSELKGPVIMAGPGSGCEVPNMCLPPFPAGAPGAAQKKKY